MRSQLGGPRTGKEPRDPHQTVPCLTTHMFRDEGRRFRPGLLCGAQLGRLDHTLEPDISLQHAQSQSLCTMTSVGLATNRKNCFVPLDPGYIMDDAIRMIPLEVLVLRFSHPHHDPLHRVGDDMSDAK